MNAAEGIINWLKKIHGECVSQTRFIKVWLRDDVRQHDARLEEYKKQTKLLSEIRDFLKDRGSVK